MKCFVRGRWAFQSFSHPHFTLGIQTKIGVGDAAAMMVIVKGCVALHGECPFSMDYKRENLSRYDLVCIWDTHSNSGRFFLVKIGTLNWMNIREKERQSGDSERKKNFHCPKSGLDLESLFALFSLLFLVGRARNITDMHEWSAGPLKIRKRNIIFLLAFRFTLQYSVAVPDTNGFYCSENSFCYFWFLMLIML